MKKRVIIGVTLLGVVVIAGAFVNNTNKKISAVQAAMQNMQTDEVSVRSLIKSVGATGTVVSVNSKDVSVALSNTKVSEVLVEVGDEVSIGEKIVVFHTEDIEDSLSTAQKSLSTAQQKNSISMEEAKRKVEDAQRTESYQLDAAKTKVETTYNDYKTAMNNYNSGNDTLDTLRNSENELYNLYQTKATELKAALQKWEEAKATVSNGDAGIEALCKEAEATYNATNTAYKAAESNYLAKVKEREQQQNAVDTLCKQYNTAANTYNNAVLDYNNTEASQASNVASVKNNQKTTSLNINTDTEKQQIEKYQEQLELGILTSPMNGVVTAVNYQNGSTYNGGTILTIQDCSSYEIEAQIGEYDISDVQLGQEVLIKTNATGQEELKGEVIFVSPTATKIAGTTSSNPTYLVRIAVLSENNRLKLDMSASLSIIVESHDNVYTVPYNAVEEDSDGNHFITVVVEGEENKKIFVKIVMESNYYTEIESDEIHEGLQIYVEPEDLAQEQSMFQMRGGF